VVILIVLIFLSKGIILSTSGSIHSNNTFETKSVIVNIDKFDDFTEGELDSLIIAEKTSSNLIFNYVGGSTDTLLGWYYLSLDDYGNCTDFEFGVSLNLKYNNTMFGKIKIILGGYYNSQYQFVSSSILPETNNEKTLVMVAIEDLIDDGLYMITEDFPNDTQGGGMGWADDSDRDIDFKFELIRTGEQMEYEYWIDYVGGGGGSWTKNMHKIINYFIFIVEIHGDVTSTVNAKFFNLITELNCSHEAAGTSFTEPTDIVPISHLVLGSFTGLFMILIVIKKQRKKIIQSD